MYCAGLLRACEPARPACNSDGSEEPVVFRTPLISKGDRREPLGDTKCPQAALRNEQSSHVFIIQ